MPGRCGRSVGTFEHVGHLLITQTFHVFNTSMADHWAAAGSARFQTTWALFPPQVIAAKVSVCEMNRPGPAFRRPRRPRPGCTSPPLRLLVRAAFTADTVSQYKSSRPRTAQLLIGAQEASAAHRGHPAFFAEFVHGRKQSFSYRCEFAEGVEPTSLHWSTS